MNTLTLLMVVTTGIWPGVVIKPVANMHSSPTEEADVVSQAIYGTTVEVVEEETHWLKVRTPDHYMGWITFSSLRRAEPGSKPYGGEGRVAEVNRLSANLYRETDVTKHQPLLTVPYGTRLEVAGTRLDGGDRWLEIRLPDGGSAWLQSGDVSPDPKPLSIKETIELAKRFLGVTYLWGGSSSFGFDCSGFTQMLMRAHGAIMPRDADLQAAWDGVVEVKRGKLKPGDLLFFGEKPEKITHTGMFIGGGKFIHDTTYEHPGVQISRLKDQPWTKLLVACRRLK